MNRRRAARDYKLLLAASLSMLILAGCAAQKPVERNDYSAFRREDPHSILIVPVVNRSVDVDAPDYFFSTLARPVAERGYYVFPVNMVKEVMDEDGLADANLVHAADPTRLADIFGADAILYVTIERWDARYALVSTTVTVEFNYSLKSGETGEELWHAHERVVYQPQHSNSGNPLADLLSDAIVAAVTRAAPNYIPLAQKANASALFRQYKGLPAGPYAADYGLDQDRF